MKLLKLAFFALILGSLSMASCSKSNQKDNQHEQTEVDKSGPEYTSQYICPMHCEGSGSTEEGVCPVCGMDYVKNKSYESAEEQTEEHDAHHSHDSVPSKDMDTTSSEE